MAVFAMVFGYALRVLPLIVNNAWVATENPYWHFLGLSFSPLRRGATCAVRTLNTLDRIWALMGASGLDFGGSLVPPGWVFGELQWQFSPWFLAMPLACRHGF